MDARNQTLHQRQNSPKNEAILLGFWHHIMEPIWQCRNDFLHKSDNIVVTHEHQQLDSELKDWKILSRDRLHHTQQYLVSYSTSDFNRWTLQHKKNTLHVLQLANRNYKQYLDSQAHLQPHITKFFMPLPTR